MAPLIPGLLVAYLLVPWSASALRVFKARNDDRPEAIEAMYRQRAPSDRWILKAIAGNSACPSELLAEIAGLEDPDYEWHGGLRDLVAGSRRPAIVLVSLNPSTPPEVLRHLAHAGWPEVISNPATPVDVLQEALSNGRLETRRRIARTASSVEILESLSVDTDREVRRRVATNPNAPASALDRLAGDSAGSVRKAVASNLNTPEATLESLCSDASPTVRKQALGRLGRAPGGNGNQQLSESDGG